MGVAPTCSWLVLSFYSLVQVTCRAARPSHWLARDHVLHDLLARECITCSLEGLSWFTKRDAAYLSSILYHLSFLVPDCDRQLGSQIRSVIWAPLSYLPFCGDIGVCQRNKMMYLFLPFQGVGGHKF